MHPAESTQTFAGLGRAGALSGVLVFLVFVSACDPAVEAPSDSRQPIAERRDLNATPEHDANRVTNRGNGSQGAAASTAVRVERARIVAFGDSLTAGLGVPPAQTYPAHLQRRLDQAGYHIQVINAGVSGETSAGGLRRVDWVLKSDPDLVILELGGNDGLRGIDPKETRGNLEQIIKRFQAEEVPVILAGMKLPPNYGEQFTSRFAAIYPDLAQSYRLPLMPFFLEDVALQDELTQADGIHPTGDGYRVIVENLFPVLEPLLKKIPHAAS